jgi:hypothetical protein
MLQDEHGLGEVDDVEQATNNHHQQQHKQQ